MPILGGSVSFLRYRVLESPERGPGHRSLAVGLKKLCFQPLDREGEEESSSGFVELYDEDSVQFAPGSFIFAEDLIVRWRVDSIKIPAQLVKRQIDTWIPGFESRRGRPPSKKEKNEQKELIIRKLRKQAFILTKTYDVRWRLQADEVHVWATSRRVLDEILASLEEAFELVMYPLAPGGLWADFGVELDGLKPTPELFGEWAAAED